MENNQVTHSLETASQKIQAETISAIDKHIADNSPTINNQDVTDFTNLEPGTALAQSWKLARPVLVFLESALYMATGWHEALRGLIVVLDTLTKNSDMPI